MGFRAHIRTKSIIEYDDGFFNHCLEELSNFVEEECPNAYTTGLGYIKYKWEIPVDETEKMIENLKTNWNPDDIIFGDYTANDLIAFFSRALAFNKKSENYRDSSFIYIDWY